ncbi:hypothetical protein HanRHA438_Chr02g0061171 [Helianthus annuus]|nr:hypothetical protein HanRHA438_Chr02g0061171 [Helianthus annuus]
MRALFTPRRSATRVQYMPDIFLCRASEVREHYAARVRRLLVTLRRASTPPAEHASPRGYITYRTYFTVTVKHCRASNFVTRVHHLPDILYRHG